MPIAITATPAPATASVTLQVTGALPATSPVAITRTDSNGVNPVRLKDGQVPSGGTLIIVDAEAALAGLIRYDVRDTGTNTASASFTWTATGPRVAPVQLPQLSAVPLEVIGYSASRTGVAQVHQVIDGQPVPEYFSGRQRQGQLTFLAASHPDALAVEAALNARVFLLRQRDQVGLDLYAAATDIRVLPEELLVGGWVWTVEASYQEVRRPTLPLLGTAGWSYADVTAGHASYSVVASSWATYATLAVG